MFDLNIYAIGLALVLSIAVTAWLVSIPKQDVSFVDSLWSLFFLVLTLAYITWAPSLEARSYILLFVVTVWATRLSVFITLRNRGQPEDRRYQAIRAENEPGFWLKSLYIVFGLQAVLAWIISLPLLGGVLGSAPLGWLDYAAVLLWLVGFGFEAIGDQQLASFKANPANKGQVLDRGLWRYTRHPNYFGEACIWWAFYLFALSAGAWWSIVGPILMTVLLLRVSGVTLLEKDISERRPAYREYIRRTNAFFPGPPRAADAAGPTSGDS
jgi:steroid 5-alpha reductase family enzyme